MRMTPLKRKSTLKKGSKGLKKSPLAKRSVSKTKWEELYKDAKAKYGKLVRPVDKPHLLLSPKNLWQVHPHHPKGRWGENILFFFWISSTLHDRIHQEPDWAYSVGWLTPEYRGYQPDPNHPKPWTQEQESQVMQYVNELKP